MTSTSHFPPSPTIDGERLLKVIQASLGVRRHLDFFQWLQGDFQLFLPHDVFIAAWGDFDLGIVYMDVVSALPGIRTGPIIERDITPFTQSLFADWLGQGCAPFFAQAPDGFAIADKESRCPIGVSFRAMRSILVHGMKDERDRHDCLYLALSTADRFPAVAPEYMALLLPHIDSALRQVIHLPEQLRKKSTLSYDAAGSFGLSGREAQIMEWVGGGKTNEEIGMILGISAFTVKNHLQRIFKKLDVKNRAQAVDKLFRAGHEI